MTPETICNMVRLLVTALVNDEGAVKVSRTEARESIIIEVEVAEDDIGKLIGRQGRHLAAMRMLVQAASRKLGKRVTIQPLNTWGTPPEDDETNGD